MSRQGGGGATVAKTKMGLILGVWTKEGMINNITKGKQLACNSGACTMRVKAVAKIIADAGM